MVIVYIVLFILFVFYCLKDFKRGFILYSALKIILHTGVCIKITPPVLTFEFIANIFLFFIFLIKYKNIVKKKKFPLKSSFIIVFISYTLSTIFSVAPFQNSILGTAQALVNDYVFVYMFYYVIQSVEDISLFIKRLISFFALLCIYGLWERYMESNPIMEFELSQFVDKTDSVGKIYLSRIERGRSGFLRVQSLMPISITFGAYAALIAAFYAFYLQKYRSVLNDNKLVLGILLLILFIIGLFISNSRSPFFCFIVAMVPLINFKSLINKKGILILVAFSLIIPFLLEFITPYLDVLNKSFDEDSEVGGSSVGMRLGQFLIGLKYFLDAPILGNGVRSMSYILSPIDSIYIFGAESIWIWLMVERGALGVISYIAVFYQAFFKLKSKYNQVFFFWFISSWLILQTMTTTPGLPISFFLILLLSINKLELFRLHEN